MIYSDKLKLRKNRQMHHLKSKPCSIAEPILRPKKFLNRFTLCKTAVPCPLMIFLINIFSLVKFNLSTTSK